MWQCPKCKREFKNTNQDHYCGTIETIDQYISEQPNEVQPVLQKVRETIRAAAPDAKEKISWRMPTFWQNENLIHFAAFKKHLGIYPGDLSLAPFEDRLEGYRRTKGAIQFPYDKPIDYELIADITRWRVSVACEKKRLGEIHMPLDTIEAIKTRYSCREFSDKMPSEDKLRIIAEAAAASPSGMDRQLWRIIIVKNQDLLADLEAEGMKNLEKIPGKAMYERIMSRGGKLYYNAPCMIVVAIAKAEPAGAELFDCGIVSENIALAATSLGVDNLICGLIAFSFAGEMGAEFKQRLGFPEGYEIGIAVLLGHAATPGGKPHEPDFSKITIVE